MDEAMDTIVTTNPLDVISRAGNYGGFTERVSAITSWFENSGRTLSPIERCLPALLTAFQWHGEDWQIVSSLPHGRDGIQDITDFENVMAELGFGSEPIKNGRLNANLRDSLPCLFLPRRGGAWVVLDKSDAGYTIFDSETGERRTVNLGDARIKGESVTFSPLETLPLQAPLDEANWLGAVLTRLSSVFKLAIAMTFLSNVFSLMAPLYVMSIYDRVLNTQSVETLLQLSIGIGLVLLFDFMVRRVRGRAMAFAGSRFSYLLGQKVFSRMLMVNLPVGEGTPVGGNIPRFKDIERVRQFIFGASGISLLELPFTLIYVGVIFYLGGVLGVIPLVVGLLFIGLGVVLGRFVKRLSSDLARNSSQRQSLLLEAISKLRAIKITGTQDVWNERFQEVSASAAVGVFHVNLLQSLILTTGSTLGYATALGTMIGGIYLVLAEQMTAGALIASMMLVWRIISPLQGTFMGLTRLWRLRSSIAQITNLFKIKPEISERQHVSLRAKGKGQVQFSNVALRYGRESEPAIAGLNFTVEPGESMSIVGDNGSGKSSILKMAAGLYPPSVGSVRLDGRDVRQLDPLYLRHLIAFAPQTPQFFEGSIRENLAYANAIASEDDMIIALELAGALEAVEAMKKGLDTDAVLHGHTLLPYSLAIRLSLARAYIKKAPVVILDEPINGLDIEGDFAFVSALESLKRTSTVLTVTHRPGHIRSTDKVLYLERGRVKFFGPLTGNEDRLFNSLMGFKKATS